MMDSRSDDPLIGSFLAITRRYRLLIVSSTAAATAIGAAIGALIPRPHEGTVIVAAAVVDPEGSIADLQTIDTQLQQHVERMVLGGQLSVDTMLDAIPLREPPPSSRKLPLLSLHASSPDPVSVRKALDRSLAHLRSLENPLYAAERRQIDKSLQELELELERLSRGRVSSKTQEALQKAILDRSETKRALSPLRTHASEVVATLPVKQPSRERNILAGAALAMVGGICAAYVIAFFLAAIGLLRQTQPRAA